MWTLPRAAHPAAAVYAAFNARGIATILAVFAPQVRWPRAWEGDYVTGHDTVRDYWTYQWQTTKPWAEPTAMHERPDSRIVVSVCQHVWDLQGVVLLGGPVTHVYSFRDGLIIQMAVEPGA